MFQRSASLAQSFHMSFRYIDDVLAADSPHWLEWSQIPYEDLTPEAIELPPRGPDKGYVRPPMSEQTFVPEVY